MMETQKKQTKGGDAADIGHDTIPSLDDDEFDGFETDPDSGSPAVIESPPSIPEAAPGFPDDLEGLDDLELPGGDDEDHLSPGFFPPTLAITSEDEDSEETFKFAETEQADEFALDNLDWGDNGDGVDEDRNTPAQAPSTDVTAAQIPDTLSSRAEDLGFGGELDEVLDDLDLDLDALHTSQFSAPKRDQALEECQFLFPAHQHSQIHSSFLRFVLPCLTRPHNFRHCTWSSERI